MYRYIKNQKASPAEVEAAQNAVVREVESFMHDFQQASLFCDAGVHVDLYFGRNSEGKKEISGRITFD